jgi:hypothetical protein
VRIAELNDERDYDKAYGRGVPQGDHLEVGEDEQYRRERKGT